jgi:hypothetical protein
MLQRISASLLTQSSWRVDNQPSKRLYISPNLFCHKPSETKAPTNDITRIRKLEHLEKRCQAWINRSASSLYTYAIRKKKTTRTISIRSRRWSIGKEIKITTSWRVKIWIHKLSSPSQIKGRPSNSEVTVIFSQRLRRFYLQVVIKSNKYLIMHRRDQSHIHSHRKPNTEETWTEEWF